ncbi:MAG: hypothetical protein WC146_02230 [Patescibacteria group bacterium]
MKTLNKRDMNFFARYKKLFLVILFFGLVFIIGYFLWSIFFRAEIVPTEPTTIPTVIIDGLPSAGTSTGGIIGEETKPSGLPEGIPYTNVPSGQDADAIATGGITAVKTIADSPTLNPTLSNDGKVQYYDKSDGHFYMIDKNGNKILLSDKVFHNVENIVWAPTKEKAVIEYPDGNKILYNFDTETQVTLPSFWQEFSFSTDGDKLVSESIGLDPENRWLVISNDDGSKAKAIENIGTRANTVYPSWSPNNQIVAMYTKGVDFNRQEVFFIGQNNENFKSAVIEGRGLQTQWSTEGDRLLYSVYNSNDDFKPRLWIVDAQGDTISENRKSFSVNTWADKCTFASNTEVYCAVPDYLEKNSGLFPELADKTQDSLYKIDLTTGTKKLIAVPEDAFNISEVIVPEKQDYLYFTDKTTGKIYEIKLK